MTTTPKPQAIAATILADKRQGTKFPTNLEAIVSSTSNLELECVDVPQQFEGRIELCRNTPTIFLNLQGRRFDHPRTRFTLGHELGHFFLHRAMLRSGKPIHDAIIGFGEDLPQIEREANEFSSELLLPPPLVKSFLSGNILTIERIGELSELAKASLQATAIKVATLSSSMSCFFWQSGEAIQWSAPTQAWRASKHPSSSWRNRLPESSHIASTDESFEAREVPRVAWHPNAWTTAPLYESALRTPYGRLVLVVDPSTDSFIES